MKVDHNSSEQIRIIFEQQKKAFEALPYPDVKVRKKHLMQLKSQIIKYQDAIAKAINKDFGSRSNDESKILDVMSSILEVSHCIRKLKYWMRPSKRKTELLFITNKLEVLYQPKGIVGVIVPWNFPVYLALGPLAVALAAGNRVMIKLSEVTPETNTVIRKMLSEIFNKEQVAVFGEEIVNPSHFTSLPFDHIVFTGSPAVGQLVMRSASEHLTPVTLELGGKSPALVTRNYPIADAAKRIMHGKSTNAGQICVSPDYTLVPVDKINFFVEACKSNFEKMFGLNICENLDYTSIVNDRHLKRIQEILTDAREKGAQIIPCGEYNTENFSRRMPVHIVLNCQPHMKIMQEELFGPILPIIIYDTLDQAIETIKLNERPLALYCFTHDSKELDYILKNTHSGGVTVNDWGWHVVNHDAPFGGIGNSGMGTYHGEEGFRELSHAKTIFKRHRFFPTQLFYPPYGTWIQKLMIGYYLRKSGSDIK